LIIKTHYKGDDFLIFKKFAVSLLAISLLFATCACAEQSELPGESVTDTSLIQSVETSGVNTETIDVTTQGRTEETSMKINTVSSSEHTGTSVSLPADDYILYNGYKIDLDTEAEYLKYTNQEDFNKLSNLRKLKILSIDFQKTYDIIDLRVLENLNNLEELYLYNSNHIENVESLSNLIKIKQLDFYSLNIEDIDFVVNYSNLKSIYIEDLCIKDIEPLSSCVELDTVSIINSEIRDLSALKDLKRLTYLAVNNSKVTDISVISSFPQLQYLSFSDNFICDINNVKFPLLLNRLDLSYNNISNFTSIYSLDNLEKLTLDGSNIYNGDFLANLESANNLKWLSLNDNVIGDLTFVQSFSNLEMFSFEYNNVTNLKPLYKLEYLDYIRISGNPITDLTQLEGINRINIPSGKIAVYVFDIPLTEDELNLFFENNEYAYRAYPE
jgi:Leucine-rich repeat (LRR) protein